MRLLITLALFFHFACVSFAQTIIYVDSAATGLNDGSSWANAYNDLQPALQFALPGTRIWVAKGTYHPSRTATNNPTDFFTSEYRVFKMKPGVKMYGGFNGTETHHAQRNLQVNKTILSGKNPVIPGADHSWIIVLFDQLSFTSSMDGFWIQHQKGIYGTLMIKNGNPRLSNIVVSENERGIEISDASPLIINSIVQNNGPGIRITASGDSSHPLIVNCLITNNYDHGIYVITGHCKPKIINSTIANNLSVRNNQQIRSVGIDVHTKVYNCVVGGTTGLGSNGGVTTFYNSLVPNIGSGSTWNTAMGTDGGGNVDSWPFFVDSANGDYTLQNCSPAINAGQRAILPQDELDLDSDGIYAETLPIDLGGGLRQLGTVDMGAFEFVANDTLLNKLCLGGSLKIGDSTITAHGIYTIYIPDSGRCDSMVIVDVRKMVEAKIALTPDSLSYYAVDSNASYQWYDCTHNYALPADTNQSFTPWIPSSYMVIVAKNSCVDTSDCIVVNKVGLNDPANELQVAVYPNPSSGIYHLQLWGHVTDLHIRVVDLNGKIILQHRLSNANSDTIDLSHVPKGIYLLFVGGEGFAEAIRLVKE